MGRVESRQHMRNAISLLTLRITGSDPQEEAAFAARLFREGGVHSTGGVTAALVQVVEDLLGEIHDLTGVDPQETLQRVALGHIED